MTSFSRKFLRFLMPLSVFLGVLAAHCIWSNLFPEVDSAQARWASLPGDGGYRCIVLSVSVVPSNSKAEMFLGKIFLNRLGRNG